MTTVAGLDLSLRSAGIVAISDDRPDRMGVAWPWLIKCCGRDGNKGEDYQQRSRRVRRQAANVIRHLEPAGQIDLAVIEGPIYGGIIRPSYFDRAGLFHAVYGALDARGIPIAVVSPTTGHLFTTGKGSLPKDPDALKPLILASVRAMFPELPDQIIFNDDVADAIGLGLMGCMSLGMKTSFRPRRWQYSAVYTPTWPHGQPVQRPAVSRA